MKICLALNSYKKTEKQEKGIMRRSTQQARNKNGAWQRSSRMGSIKDYGSLPTEKISLKETAFGWAADLKICLDLDPEQVSGYQRYVDEDSEILYTEFVYKETPVKILAFASQKEKLFYYEITAETTCLNLTAKVEPSEKQAYRNYNLGGFYFEEEKKGVFLIGKGELKADGFPKADEKGLHIKNASRAAFRIHLASGRRKASVTPLRQAMEMQMSMNRYLAKTDDISREKLIGMCKNQR